ncbi:MAG: hypothetical protein V4858_13515 [Pseudomonadota bacterium]
MSTMHRNLLALAAVVALSVGCTTPPPPRSVGPAEFGTYENPKSLQAVSADRVVYQVKHLENKPFADQGFWQVALKERLVKAGYVVTSEGAIESAGKTGYYVETTAPRGTTDFMYMVALFVQDKQLIVVESAGELATYKARRDSIFAAIKAGDLAGAVAR